MATSKARSLKWLIVVSALFGAVGGLLLASLLPVRYHSQALIAITPARIPQEYVRTVSEPLEDRLPAISQTILSRTRLERLIVEFDLYASERKSMLMDEVVQVMRKNTTIRIERGNDDNGKHVSAIVVGYTGADPSKVMKVTEKLAGYVKDESLRHQAVSAEGTMAFLESQVEIVGKRLAERPRSSTGGGPNSDRRARLESEVLESTYTSLLTKLEEARMRVNLEGRQMGEQFNLIDAPRLPERPINPTRSQLAALGGAVGLALGLVLAGIVGVRRAWRQSHRSAHAPAAADAI